MDDNNCAKLIDRISRASGLDFGEIDSRIEAKRAKLSGLVSKEGAAQIIAAELGVSFENERVKISELAEGMKRVRTIGKITRVEPVREYNKNGREGKIGVIFIGDESSNMRVVLWDLHHISLIENKEIKEGDVVEITNGGMRNGELHLGTFSDIKLSSEIISEAKTEQSFDFGLFKDAKPGKRMKARAFIAQAFDPRYFDSKKNPGEKMALFNVVLDDGTETFRAVLGIEQARQMGLTDEEIFSLEKFSKKKEEILGAEKIFFGNFRNNTYFNRLEFSVSKIEEVRTEELIRELESASASA